MPLYTAPDAVHARNANARKMYGTHFCVTISNSAKHAAVRRISRTMRCRHVIDTNTHPRRRKGSACDASCCMIAVFG